MSLAEQNFGFDAGDPVILGKTNVLLFTIAGLAVADIVSAEWVLTDISPAEGSPTALVTKSTASGLSLADGVSGLDVTVALAPSDTSALSGGDYYHRLDYVHTNGGSHEMGRGRARLTPRA